MGGPAGRGFWLTGIGIWGSLMVDDVAVSGQPETVSRILTGVFLVVDRAAAIGSVIIPCGVKFVGHHS